MYFNIASVAMYLGLLWAYKYQAYNTSFTLLSLEVVAHAVLCSFLLGDAGFSEAILFLPMLFFIHPAKTRIKVVYFLAVLLGYIALVYHDHHSQPQYLLNNATMLFLNLATSSLIISIGSYIAYYTYSAIRQKEDMLKTEHSKLQEQYKIVERISVTDPLTGLFNRGKLEADILRTSKLSKRAKSDFSIIIVDVDHFKAVNDTHGHQVGDLVLKEVAASLKNSVRDTDIVGRWGGEEFLIICPHTPNDGAAKLAHKICETVASQKLPTVGQKTCSLGVSTYKNGEDVQETLARADVALYKAKDLGRNRAEVAK